MLCGVLLIGSLRLLGQPYPDSTASYQSLMWEVSGNGLSQPSYLFGTIHLIPEDSLLMPQPVLDVLDRSDQLVLEINMDGANLMQSMMSMMLKPPNSLPKLLSEEDYAYLQQFMRDSLPIQIPMYQMIKPIFVVQQVTSSYCLDGLPASYEMVFMQHAQKSDKEMAGLESVEEQMKYLDSIPLSSQAAQLMEAVRNPRAACAEYARMLRLYRQQDLDGLLRMAAEDPDMAKELGGLLDERNLNWVAQLDDRMKAASLFVAVGAGHLPGQGGVINLLRAKGYRVRPMDIYAKE